MYIIKKNLKILNNIYNNCIFKNLSYILNISIFVVNTLK